MKSQNKTKGKKGEELVKAYLVTQGLVFLEANFQIWGGEIDLIMKDGDTYVFVEVKTRYDTEIPFEELISLKKIYTLEKTAEIWLAKHKLIDVDWRIDFAGVDLNDATVHWIADCVV